MIKPLLVAFVTAIQRPTLDDADAADQTCTVTTEQGDVYTLNDIHGNYQVKMNNPFDSILFSLCEPIIQNGTDENYVLKTSNSKPVEFPVFDSKLYPENQKNLKVKRFSASDC